MQLGGSLCVSHAVAALDVRYSTGEARLQQTEARSRQHDDWSR